MPDTKCRRIDMERWLMARRRRRCLSSLWLGVGCIVREENGNVRVCYSWLACFGAGMFYSLFILDGLRWQDVVCVAGSRLTVFFPSV